MYRNEIHIRELQARSRKQCGGEGARAQMSEIMWENDTVQYNGKLIREGASAVWMPLRADRAAL